MVKLYKPRQMGNWENVLAYSGEEEDPDELTNAENAPDTLRVSPDNVCISCHRDAHQRLSGDVSVVVSPGPPSGGVALSQSLTQPDRMTASVGASAFLGVVASITIDERAGTPAMPTIVVAEPDNTRVDSTSSGGN